VVPLILVFFVAQMYLHSIPTAGNDPVLIGLLAAVGLTLGIASGFATHVRAGDNGLAVAHVGWLAATLLIAGIGSRMVFAFAVSYGLRSDLASFSIAHHILRHRLADRAGADGDLRSHHQDRNRAATRPQRDQRPDGHGRDPRHRLTTPVLRSAERIPAVVLRQHCLERRPAQPVSLHITVELALTNV